MRQLLKTKLVDMDLSVRALNCLKAAEVDTLGDLVSFNKNDLMKFRNFGKKSLTELDELVANAGGRLYLAKDSRQSPEMFVRTYPLLTQWQRTRNQMDPKGIFKSDLARRLSL